MTEAAPSPVHVHALLVCRRVEPASDGSLTVHNVVEILPVESIPGQVGPLTVVAFVRNLPEGPVKASFLLKPSGGAGTSARRYPLQGTIGRGLAGRQVALQLNIARLEVTAPGWYEIAFEWDGHALAANRVAIGLVRDPGRPTSGSAGSPPSASSPPSPSAPSHP
jgi:hypothetical protein